MGFRLKRREAATHGIRRIIRREISHAMNTMADARRDERESVHDIRTHCKKIRAVLRLAREGMKDPAYHDKNDFFRDLARPLTELRDARILLNTLDSLTKEFPAFRQSLEENYQAICQDTLKEHHTFSIISKKMHEARFHTGKVGIHHKKWNILRHGLQRTYRQGRHAFTVAAEHPTSVHLHEWRKQSKYLWYQLRIMQPMCPRTVHKVKKKCHRLTEFLGHDHDLAVLRHIAVSSPAVPGSSRLLLLTLIDQRRNVLQKKAFRLGRHIYDERPKTFLRMLQ